MLQRIQSAPGEGDALYNLATITNGWKGISLSPLYGAIFAVLLSVLFAAKIVEGEVFPDITTPGDKTIRVSIQPTSNLTSNTAPAASSATAPNVTVLPPASSSPSASPSASPTASATPNPTPTPVASPQAAISPTATQTAPTPTAPAISGTTVGSNATSNATLGPTPSPSPSLAFNKYLRETGPYAGKDYALLLIWSFIAGFAERLVPDTLNRLVTKNQSIQGTSS